MNEAQAEERYRNLIIAWENFIRDTEIRAGAKLLFNPARFETAAEAEQRKLENAGC